MRLLVTAAAALGTATVVLGPVGFAAPRAGNISVTVEFRDDGADRIRSDGGGAYQDNVENAVAYIDGSTGGLIWGTNTNGTVVRTMWFYFTNCLVGPCTPPAAWPQPLVEPSGMQANALLPNGQVPSGGLRGMTIGTDYEAWIKINIPIDTDPAYYNVCFDSRGVGPCGMPAGVNSTNAHIRRDQSDQWTMWADATDSADLIRDSQSKRNRAFTLLGTYSMPFSLTVKCVKPACS
ncbi:MAG: hypothetical protein AB7H93_06655 [Vicinamibacterales bacterium]